MGNLTVKESGEMVNFISPNVNNITSFKVHFSPKQEGTGDPSPENVRPIVGWDEVEAHKAGKNIAHVIGYSTSTMSSPRSTRYISNNYGTTLSTIDFVAPDTSVIVTQTQYETSPVNNYKNGYFTVGVDNLIFGLSYDVSFKVTNITNNPLNITLEDIQLIDPQGAQKRPNIVNGNKLIFKAHTYNRHSTALERCTWEIRNCGMSFTLSEFMVTPANVSDGVFEPYQDITIPINWTNNIGTVYGGYVDLISGELVQKWQLRQISELDIKKTSGTGTWEHRFDMKYWVTGYGYETRNTFECLADCFTLGLANHNNSFLTYVGNISVYDDTVSTADEFKAKYGQNYIAYKIKSDLWQTHQLTPQQLSTLKGQNNFWSNADYVEIEYELTETFNIQKAKRKIILNQPHVESASGDIVTFDTDMRGKLKECKVYFSPVQEGEGDPSPENVRPISGFTGCEVQRTGKNLVNPDDCLIGKYLNPSEAILSAVDWTVTDYIACKPNVTYIITGSTVTSNSPTAQLAFCDKEKNFIELRPAGKSNLTFTTPDGCAFMRLSIRNANVDEIQVEVGDTATNYEPYTGQTYPITFPTEAGTIYRGYIDLIKGELVQTWKKVHITKDDIGGVATGTRAPYRPYTYVIGDAKLADFANFARNIVCDKIKSEEINLWDPVEYEGYMNNSRRFVFGVPSSLSTKELVQNWMDEIGGMDLCYELETPIIYQLTPQTLQALRGTNNIWSDANGQVEIKYWKH